MISYKEKYNEYLTGFDGLLEDFCRGLNCKPEKLAESLKYSLKSGGKRLRPVLMFAVGELLEIGRAHV